MGSYYTISVPVKKHISKFIISTEGNPFRIAKENFVWKLIRPYMVYKVPPGWHRHEDFDKLYPAQIRLQLPMSAIKFYGLHIGKSETAMINNVLSDYFSIQLYYFVELNTSRDGRYRGINRAIEKFCEQHQIIIEQDIYIDALQKIFFRRKQSFKKKLGNCRSPLL